MSGKLIIIESGSDASGKATQTKKLYERLLKDGYNVKKVEYPNYDSESSALVKMYLRGEFGKKATDVDPYIASTFFFSRQICFILKLNGKNFTKMVE